MLNVDEQLHLIKRNTAEVIPEDELARKIKRKGSLIIKFGVDPTTPDIHLGHSVILLKLRTLQDLGHKVVLLIGDFTARVGDPTGRVKARKPLTVKQIRENAKTYREQAFKILDPSKTRIDYNSRWLGKMNFSQVLKLTSRYTVARMLERDDFSLRYRENIPIGLHEFLYPLMQAYDSVALRADVEIGGTDQKFNLLLGRYIQKSYRQSPQVIITMPILEGLDGKEKMSKSLGNYIGVTEPPSEMYGKIMSIPDELIFRYFRLLTLLPESEIERLEKSFKEGKLHPKKAKKMLAFELVRFYYSEEEAKYQDERFERVFSKKEVPPELVSYPVNTDKIWVVELLRLTGLARSGSEARRLIQQGGVKWDGERIREIDRIIFLRGEHILQVGKKKFLKVVKR
ncbi:tyrosine--tRNA ligase [Candidatus Aerophobetes bacterium]|nr:tyrosine--tRNA ligase [Candidatus Aerophobetes bacterium]